MEKNYSKRVCPVEISGALESPLRRLFQNPTKILKPFIKKGNKVLDFGCGPGFFTIDIAQLVGSSGFVYAADLQEGMLERVKNKIAALNLSDRIKVHKCEESSINLNDKVDFILAFYMIHELVKQDTTFKEFDSILNDNGKLLIIEPVFHVTKKDFENMLFRLEKTGFKIVRRSRTLVDRLVLLQKKNKSTVT
jgi:ubiquinone/menaquinone biosynthesis C-methylase UbiE